MPIYGIFNNSLYNTGYSKTAPIKRKALKSRYILTCSLYANFLFNNKKILKFLA